MLSKIMLVGSGKQDGKLVFFEQPIVGRAHEPADPLR